MTVKELLPKVKTKINRTVQGLTEIAEEFLMKEYGIELTIPIKINGRLTKAYGQYAYDRIDISKKSVIYACDESLLNTLYHECIHYALEETGREGINYDGHPEFEKELIMKGVPSEFETERVGETFKYSCTSCENTYNLNRKMKSKREYICHCDSTLELTRHYVGDGFKVVKEFKI